MVCRKSSTWAAYIASMAVLLGRSRIQPAVQPSDALGSDGSSAVIVDRKVIGSGNPNQLAVLGGGGVKQPAVLGRDVVVSEAMNEQNLSVRS